mgnify:FL=1
MIISPIRVAKSEMVLRILGLARVSYNGSNHACFVSRISVSFAAKKRKSADIVRFGFGEAISFSPSVSFTLMHVYINTGIK